MITKTKLIEHIERFPEQFSIDDLIERLILVEKIENGKIPSENDDVLSEKELVKEIETGFEHDRPAVIANQRTEELSGVGNGGKIKEGNMELKLNIGYRELIEMIKQLPASQIRKLKSELALITTDNDREKEISDFQGFLSEGPVMDDDQYQDFLSNRKYFNTWRTN